MRWTAGFCCATDLPHGCLKPYCAPHLKVAVIPQSGVDSDIFKPGVPSAFRSKYGLEGKFIFLFGAVFDERKGVMTTINAFHKALQKIHNAHLVMIGIGKLWEAAQARVKELSLTEHVTFIPWMDNKELPAVFAGVDVLVHPSEPYRDWEEQYGWTMLQASASGLPVIATKIGSIPEAVLDGRTGLLVEPKSVEALRDAMETLVSNDQLRKDLGTAGRTYIEERFSHRAVAQRMEHFLRTL